MDRPHNSDDGKCQRKCRRVRTERRSDLKFPFETVEMLQVYGGRSLMVGYAFKARLGLRTKEFKDDVLGEGGEVGGFGDLKMSKKN